MKYVPPRKGQYFVSKKKDKNGESTVSIITSAIIPKGTNKGVIETKNLITGLPFERPYEAFLMKNRRVTKKQAEYIMATHFKDGKEEARAVAEKLPKYRGRNTPIFQEEQVYNSNDENNIVVEKISAKKEPESPSAEKSEVPSLEKLVHILAENKERLIEQLLKVIDYPDPSDISVKEIKAFIFGWFRIIPSAWKELPAIQEMMNKIQ